MYHVSNSPEQKPLWNTNWQKFCLIRKKEEFFFSCKNEKSKKLKKKERKLAIHECSYTRYFANIYLALVNLMVLFCNFFLLTLMNIFWSLPSTIWQSSLPWWCTEKPWAWQIRCCRSWWCRCLVPPICPNTWRCWRCRRGRPSAPRTRCPCYKDLAVHRP